MNDFILSSDCYGILNFKLVEAPFFLEHVLDKSATAIGHFTQPIRQSTLHWILRSVCFLAVGRLVWHVPHIVRNELLHALSLFGIDAFFLKAGQSLR